MLAKYHKKLKRKYIRYGRDESFTDRYSRWRSDHPITWLDVDDNGNQIDEDGNIINPGGPGNSSDEESSSDESSDNDDGSDGGQGNQDAGGDGDGDGDDEDGDEAGE